MEQSMVCIFSRTHFPFYNHRKTPETNSSSINCFSCMALYGAIYDLHVRSTRGRLLCDSSIFCDFNSISFRKLLDKYFHTNRKLDQLVDQNFPIRLSNKLCKIITDLDRCIASFVICTPKAVYLHLNFSFKLTTPFTNNNGFMIEIQMHIYHSWKNDYWRCW